jgi:hypothetical protein
MCEEKLVYLPYADSFMQDLLIQLIKNRSNPLPSEVFPSAVLTTQVEND